MPSSPDLVRPPDAPVPKARALLSEALALLPSCSEPGVRERHRALLEMTVAHIDAALSPAAADLLESNERTAANWTLIEAHAARAEDARYGAGQLARGSQRAPTAEDCEDGWQRVESVVQASEEAARCAAQVATMLDHPRAWKLASRAAAAAHKARQLLLERNRAYTFHANPRFSFGEGWYLAAAAVLTGVPIQVEPDQVQTAQATKFLRDAGLGPLLVPYRSRPLANKALPDLVARAFRADPAGAQAKVRTAFLGAEPVPPEIERWVDQRLTTHGPRRKALVWVRYGTHHADRNTDHHELVLLCDLLERHELTPVLVGDALRGGGAPDGAADLTLFWKDPLFQEDSMRRDQLQFFEHLRQTHGLVGQLGVTTAGMDGPALLGLPTMYLTREPNVRLGKWVGAVPGYEEVVRDAGYLERIEQTLSHWRSAS